MGSDFHVLIGDSNGILKNMSTKKICNYITSKKYIREISARNKFCSNFNIEQNKSIWSQIYVMPFQILYDNCIKEMQFKILHRNIPTNKLLYKMGKIDSPRCVQCYLYIESIEHLFYECICLRQIWSHVEKIISSIVIDVKLRCQDVMLGYKASENHNVSNVLINKIILYCKHYILQCKYSGELPCIPGLRRSLKKHKQYDKQFSFRI